MAENIKSVYTSGIKSGCPNQSRSKNPPVAMANKDWVI